MYNKSIGRALPLETNIMTPEQARRQRIIDRLSTLPKITPYEPEGSPLRAVKEALSEAYHYGAKEGKRNQSAEARIAKEVAKALGLETKHVKDFLENIY